MGPITLYRKLKMSWLFLGSNKEHPKNKGAKKIIKKIKAKK